jgi:VWFA-related protein
MNAMTLVRWTTATLASAVVVSGQAGQLPTFRSTTSAVSVDVSVREGGRKPVTGLAAADFIVLDNGVRQTVTEVSYGVRPIDITIGLDVSGSVTGQVFELLRRAVVQVMGDLTKADRLKLVLFNTQVQRTVDFTADVKAVERAMRGVPAGGGTALYDAISVALVGAAEPERRQLVVFFTDGADSGSTTTQSVLSALTDRARASLAFVMSGRSPLDMIRVTGGIIYRPTQASGGPVDPYLTKLATNSGGSVVPIQANIDVGPTFRKILSDFRAAYVVFFSPTGVERTGFHTIEVQVARPNTTVQARRGYFGG